MTGATRTPGIPAAGGGGGGGAAQLTPTAVKTAAYTLAAGDLVPADATAGTVPLTLPSAPADKSQVAVKMIATSGSNTTTFTCGGADVFNKTGGPTVGTLTLLNQGVVLQYEASGGIWFVVSDDLPLGQLDARFNAAYAQVANNLSDVTAGTARTNLGLGSAATHAATDFSLVSNNLSDVTAATARTNLGLGSAATLTSAAVEQVTNKGAASGYMGLDGSGVGTSSPKLHASTHRSGGTDPIGMPSKDAAAQGLSSTTIDAAAASGTLNLPANSVTIAKFVAQDTTISKIWAVPSAAQSGTTGSKIAIYTSDGVTKLLADTNCDALLNAVSANSLAVSLSGLTIGSTYYAAIQVPTGMTTVPTLRGGSGNAAVVNAATTAAAGYRSGVLLSQSTLPSSLTLSSFSTSQLPWLGFAA